jgi:hypothetical protein
MTLPKSLMYTLKLLLSIATVTLMYITLPFLILDAIIAIDIAAWYVFAIPVLITISLSTILTILVFSWLGITLTIAVNLDRIISFIKPIEP